MTIRWKKGKIREAMNLFTKLAKNPKFGKLSTKKLLAKVGLECSIPRSSIDHVFYEIIAGRGNSKNRPRLTVSFIKEWNKRSTKKIGIKETKPKISITETKLRAKPSLNVKDYDYLDSFENHISDDKTKSYVLPETGDNIYLLIEDRKSVV